MQQNTIEREIHFYRVDTGFDPSGSPKSFNPVPVLKHIEKLKFKDGNNYWNDDGKTVACWVYGTDMPCKIALGNIRRNDFPLIENQGELTPLEIPEKAGLTEQTHIMFFEDNIVGCDINFYGPRITKLSYYLAEKAVGVAPEILNFNPILRKDIYQQLERLKFLRMIRLKLRSSHSDAISSIDDGLGEALKATYMAVSGDGDLDMDIILKAAKRSKGWLADHLNDVVKRLYKKPDIRYDVEKLVIKGYDAEKQKNVTLDLLSDKLIIKREILRMGYKSKGLNPNSAFRAIASAYEELKDELKQSPSMVL
ncbi:MAG: hypothetical protein HY869_19570 [Chloroflexi bacterium]|nr:hypothetical protein [Chloroflexota bacterium]